MFVLYNVAHAHSSIQSHDKKAWVRILGRFETREAAMKHAGALSTHDAGIEIRICPLNTFRLLLATKYSDKKTVLDMVTREREVEKYAFIQKRHKESRVKAKEEVQRNSEQRQMGDLSFSPQERLEAHSPPKLIQSNQIMETSIAALPISRDLEVRGQNFCAIAVIPDYEAMDRDEFTMRMWENSLKNSYSEAKNTAFKNISSDKKVPSVRTLLADWIVQNPPPKGKNVWGQGCINDDVFIFNPSSEDSTDSEVLAWNASRIKAQDEAIWKFFGSSPPDQEGFHSEFTQQNPPPVLDTLHEPSIQFLHMGDTADSVIEWITANCSKPELIDFDIACVAMYEWLRFETVDKVPKTYSDDNLNKLHANKVKNHESSLELESNGAKIVEVSA